ncbi:TetR family transcriptional regulator [Streptomyces sp. HUCO-GS316]|uniref:TetR/AcrR family transcriptional regulator n=1 Tax=Streptomyces sp. HUCO-GS316 TaxID=2692198 RepID=UPI001368BC0D|nr:TetR/AcrR family transcriptional regulator [Streptomyces sp. HUCO-GS316]MXM68962.1 TetR family transcriptional regulator [Streptomyces sp. HUCO-GS316]
MEGHTDQGLPAHLADAWGLRDRPAKGPKRGLSLRRIVDAAVAVAGAESLAAVSMSRVAAELDASPMSLYRYVASKEDLLLLMVDAIYRTPPSPHAADGGWREGLRRWACEQHAILDAHLWALYVPVSGPPMTPHQLNWLEHGLARLGTTALAESEKLSVIMLLSGYIRNEATVTAEVRQSFLAAAPDERAAMASYGRLMRGLTGPGRFPAMNRVIDAGVLDEPTGSDKEFTFGLDRVLDGVGALVRARAKKGDDHVPAGR